MKKLKTAFVASLILIGINGITKESVAASTLETTTELATQQFGEQVTKVSYVASKSANKSTHLISKDKAIAIAKKKASGTVTKVELDYDKGVAVYEIEIRNGKTEYDIKVNAKTGAIVKLETDYNNKSAQTVTSKSAKSTQKATSKSTSTSTQLISKDKAIAIAKKRVSGTVTKVELDYDKGVAVYEMEIRNGKTEYDIKVNAKTGAIVKLESDYDD